MSVVNYFSARVPVETRHTSWDEIVWPFRKEMLAKMRPSSTMSLSLHICFVMSTCSNSRTA
jgi:hypothetical protein